MRWLCLLLAAVSFALAALGVFLPGLPSTPFLLVTSYFLVRSSPSLHARLRRSRRFGPLLDNWERHRALTRRTKRISLAASTFF
ncbi:MAG: YbaN family protein, partial [Bryobacteraceae bacterium]